MHHLYNAALWLFPADFRGAFGAAMRRDFEQRVDDARQRCAAAATWIAWREVVSLVPAAVRERMAKATAAPFQRDLIFRDHSRMRPPGASKASWYMNL